MGITGVRLSIYRCTWKEAILAPFSIVWRPQALLILVYEAAIFGFTLGVHQTLVILLKQPKPVGYGLSQIAAAGVYGTPLVQPPSFLCGH